MSRLGKGSPTQETQTLPALNHTPYGRHTVEHAYYTALYCTSSRALAGSLEVRSLGRWICMVLEWTPATYDRPSLLQRQFISQEKHGRLRSHQTFSSISLLGTLGPGDRRLCMRLVHQGTGYIMRSECIKLVLVSFTLIYTHCQLHVC